MTFMIFPALSFMHFIGVCFLCMFYREMRCLVLKGDRFTAVLNDAY